jgi:hypothetical protein
MFPIANHLITGIFNKNYIQAFMEKRCGHAVDFYLIALCCKQNKIWPVKCLPDHVGRQHNPKPKLIIVAILMLCGLSQRNVYSDLIAFVLLGLFLSFFWDLQS